MNLKRLTRGPFLWVLLAVVLIWIGMSTLASPKISKIDTSDGFALLQGTTVEQAKMTDGEQRVDLTLTKDFVVGDDNLKPCFHERENNLAVLCVGMPRHVGHRLSPDVVGCHLDGCRQ